MAPCDMGMIDQRVPKEKRGIRWLPQKRMCFMLQGSTDPQQAFLDWADTCPGDPPSPPLPSSPKLCRGRDGVWEKEVSSQSHPWQPKASALGLTNHLWTNSSLSLCFLLSSLLCPATTERRFKKEREALQTPNFWLRMEQGSRLTL